MEKAKIEASIRHMNEHPDDFLTHEEVCRKFGVLIPEEGEIVSGVDAEAGHRRTALRVRNKTT
jgi:hypothetical protein